MTIYVNDSSVLRMLWRGLVCSWRGHLWQDWKCWRGVFCRRCWKDRQDV